MTVSKLTGLSPTPGRIFVPVINISIIMLSLYRTLLVFFLLSAVPLPGQTIISTDASYVEFSPAELQSLIRKLARYQQRIAATPATVGNVVAAPNGNTSPELNELSNQLRRMEGMLLRLSERSDGNNAAAYGAPSSVTPSMDDPGQDELLDELHRQRRGIDDLEDRLATAPPSSDSGTIEFLRSELENMRRQLAEKQVAATPDPDPAPAAPRKPDTTVQIVVQEVAIPENNPFLDALNDEVIALRKSIADQRRADSTRLANAPSTVIAPAASPPAPIARAPESRNWPAIRFANGSDKVPATDQSIIQSIIRAYRENPATRLSIVGFASPKGNPAFNKQLSARRAEAVSRALQEAGINPANIDTVYGGIDYQTTDPAAARRVEIRTAITP